MKENQDQQRWLHPRHILVATDLGDSEVLLPMAIEQAKIHQAAITLLHAQPNAAPRSLDVQAVIAAGGAQQNLLAAEKMMAEFVAQVRQQGIECEGIVRQGAPVVELLGEQIQRTKAGRLIMGTHGRGLLGQLVLGSVAKTLLHQLAIPIFAIGPRVVVRPGTIRPRRILCPVALTEHNLQDALLMRSICEHYGAELILLHVITPEYDDKSRHPSPDIESVKRKLEALLAEAGMLESGRRTYVCCGDLVGETLSSAARFDADWIIVGSNERRRFQVLAEDPIYRIIADSSVPVLTLPHADGVIREDSAI